MFSFVNILCQHQYKPHSKDVNIIIQNFAIETPLRRCQHVISAQLWEIRGLKTIYVTPPPPTGLQPKQYQLYLPSFFARTPYDIGLCAFGIQRELEQCLGALVVTNYVITATPVVSAALDLFISGDDLNIQMNPDAMMTLNQQ